MPAIPNSPLNDDHLKQINAGLEALKVAETQIMLARNAGLDVTKYENELNDQRTKLTALKNTYFPGSY